MLTSDRNKHQGQSPSEYDKDPYIFCSWLEVMTDADRGHSRKSRLEADFIESTCVFGLKAPTVMIGFANLVWMESCWEAWSLGLILTGL